jgi:hypothetical protein
MITHKICYSSILSSVRQAKLRSEKKKKKKKKKKSKGDPTGVKLRLDLLLLN